MLNTIKCDKHPGNIMRDDDRAVCDASVEIWRALRNQGLAEADV